MNKNRAPLKNARHNILLKNIADLVRQNLEDPYKKIPVSRQNMSRWKQNRLPRLQSVGAVAMHFNMHIVELLLTKEELLNTVQEVIKTSDASISYVTPNVMWGTLFEDAISINIKRQRAEKDLTLKETVHRMDNVITHTTLNRYENGDKTNLIRIDIIPRLANVLEMNILKLLTPRENVIPVAIELAQRYYIPK